MNEENKKEYERLNKTIKAMSETMAELMKENNKLKKESKCEEEKEDPVDYMIAATNLRDGMWERAKCNLFEDYEFIIYQEDNNICIELDGDIVQLNKFVDITDILDGEWSEWKKCKDE